MSGLQEQAVQMIGSLSDDNVSFLIEIIQRLMPNQERNEEEGIQAVSPQEFLDMSRS